MKYILSILSAVAAVVLLISPEAVSEAVRVSAESCLEVVVPSLFAFTILAVYLQKSGLYRVALRPITFPLSKLLRLDEELCAVFVLSNVGGYPVGAKLLSELVAQGRLSRKNAGEMLCFCFGSGPGFMIGIAGMRIFGSAKAGLALFGICFCSSLLIAAFMSARCKFTLTDAPNRFELNSQTLISSVSGAARVMFTVCAMITGFAAISAVLKKIGVYSLFSAAFGSDEILPALLEVTRIRGISSSEHAFVFCAALLSFGGICVIMQIRAIAADIPLKGFLISRAAAAVLSALIALPFAKNFPPAAAETLANGSAVEPFSKNAVLSVCVLLMCAILLIDAGRAVHRGKTGGK